MVKDEEQSVVVAGILGCIAVGTAHLSEEERKKWSDGAEPNLLLVPEEEADE